MHHEGTLFHTFRKIYTTRDLPPIHHPQQLTLLPDNAARTIRKKRILKKYAVAEKQT
jgi:hypothetical protein